MSCRTTSTREAWVELGEMITRTISRLFTGGAMEKRDPVDFRAIETMTFADQKFMGKTDFFSASLPV
jgi:hypothetical protein